MWIEVTSDNFGARFRHSVQTDENGRFNFAGLVVGIRCQFYDADGRNFKVVGKVNGAGNSAVEKTYTFLSAGLVEGKNYYRLAQVDFDGAIKYSSIVSLSFAPGLSLRIEPNPVISNLILKATSSIIGKQYYISSSAGKVVQKGSITGETINVASLANGMYFLNVEGDGKKFTSTMFAKQ